MKIGPIFLVIFLTDKQTEEVKTLPHPAIYPLSLSLSLSLSMHQQAKWQRCLYLYYDNAVTKQ